MANNKAKKELRATSSFASFNLRLQFVGATMVDVGLRRALVEELHASRRSPSSRSSPHTCTAWKVRVVEFVAKPSSSPCRARHCSSVLLQHFASSSAPPNHVQPGKTPPSQYCYCSQCLDRFHIKLVF